MPPGVACALSGQWSRPGWQAGHGCLLRLRKGAAALLFAVASAALFRAVPRPWVPPAPDQPGEPPAPHSSAAMGARGRVASSGGHRSRGTRVNGSGTGLTQPLRTTHLPGVPQAPLLTQG